MYNNNNSHSALITSSQSSSQQHHHQPTDQQHHPHPIHGNDTGLQSRDMNSGQQNNYGQSENHSNTSRSTSNRIQGDCDSRLVQLPELQHHSADSQSQAHLRRNVGPLINSTPNGNIRNAATRMQHVAPNNHSVSPKQPAFVSQQQNYPSSNNGPHMTFAYNNNAGNNHELYQSQAFAQNSSHTMNPLTASTNGESEFRNGAYPSAAGPLSAFSASTSVSAATAVANIASLINASTSSNGNQSSDPPMAKSNNQIQTQRQGYNMGHPFPLGINHTGQVNVQQGFNPNNHMEKEMHSEENTHGMLNHNPHHPSMVSKLIYTNFAI